VGDATKSKIVTVRNTRQQPVELHVADRVVVVAPGSAADLEESELDSPQVQVLVRRRLIELKPSAVPVAAAAAAVAKQKPKRSVEGDK
jgi:hypothetical protein